MNQRQKTVRALAKLTIATGIFAGTAIAAVVHPGIGIAAAAFSFVIAKLTDAEYHNRDADLLQLTRAKDPDPHDEDHHG